MPRYASPPASTPAEDQRCIIYVAATSLYLANFRIPLMRRMMNAGWRVIAVAPADVHTARLVEAGIDVRRVPVAREVGALIRHARLAGRLVRLYRRERPAIVHHFNATPVLYGALAARLAGVPATVNAITGLGSVFSSTHWDAPLLRAWMRLGYRCAARVQNHRMIFQNPDDMQRLIGAGVVRSRDAVLIRGSGVDITRFAPTPEPSGVPTILYCGRLLWGKGLGDLVAAARLLRAANVSCQVHLVGWIDAAHHDAVSIEQVQAWAREGVVKWLGSSDKMPEVIAAAHVVVLPATACEGMPGSLLEASACARAVVATDVPGCREAVEHGVNGWLVPPGDPQALANALATLIDDANVRQAFGRAGRERVVAHFSEAQVIGATLDVYAALNDAAAEAPGARLDARCPPAAPSRGAHPASVHLREP